MIVPTERYFYAGFYPKIRGAFFLAERISPSGTQADSPCQRLPVHPSFVAPRGLVGRHRRRDPGRLLRPRRAPTLSPRHVLYTTTWASMATTRRARDLRKPCSGSKVMSTSAFVHLEPDSPMRILHALSHPFLLTCDG